MNEAKTWSKANFRLLILWAGAAVPDLLSASSPAALGMVYRENYLLGEILPNISWKLQTAMKIEVLESDQAQNPVLRQIIGVLWRRRQEYKLSRKIARHFLNRPPSDWGVLVSSFVRWSEEARRKSSREICSCFILSFLGSLFFVRHRYL